jgi:uncharacterized metal-binding protein
MPQCECGGKNVIIYSCSCGSNVGQIANDAAKTLDRLGKGIMGNMAGIGIQMDSTVSASKKADTRVVIDGCSVSCVRDALDKAGLKVDLHIVVTDLDIKKEHNFEYTNDQVNAVVEEVVDKLKTTHTCSAKGDD